MKKRKEKQKQTNKQQKQKSALFRFPRVSWTGMPSLPRQGQRWILKVRGLKGEELIPGGGNGMEQSEVHTWCGW